MFSLVLVVSARDLTLPARRNSLELVDRGWGERVQAWEPSGLTGVKVYASLGALWPCAHYSVLLNDDKPQRTVGFTCESENSGKPGIEIET